MPELTRLRSPVGTLHLLVHEGTLCGLAFEESRSHLEQLAGRRFGAVPPLGTQRAGEISALLEAYFGGELGALERIPVEPGGSAFQRRVWAELRRIPAGRTASYLEVARAIGRADASRAVATANARNPIAIVVPCHRVIHADGSLSGYGGGVERKRWLLGHEGAILC